MSDVDHRAVDHRLSRRGVVVAAVIALIVSLLQSPGRIATDTKLDLTANPLGFLARAAHLWTPDAPMGQVQNQAYGYFFPHGAFFALGDIAHLPPWITQRLWWALLLTVGFVGVVRLAEQMRLGSPGSRVIAGVVFVLSPRVLTTLGSISSETLPMMVAPWVLLPVMRALDGRDSPHPLWRDALRSAVAVALMGAVNAVATVAALGVAVVWWLMHPLVQRDVKRWITFGGWWALGLALACAWWLVPLLILSRVSPPFLDFIESSRVTTQWTSLTEVLRGTSAWTPFVSPERVAGAVLVTQPAAVVATGLLAAAGLTGLCMRHMPFRGRLVTILMVGLCLMCVGYVGGLDSPIAEPVRVFLDGPGAALRNVHKFEPFIRLPLVLGVAHLLARVPLPDGSGSRNWLSAFAHPQRARPVAAAIAVLVALVGAGSLMWTGQLAPSGAYREIPDYWRQTSQWLQAHSTSTGQTPTGDAAPTRALVVPGAPFADQLWGATRDEPLQPLADSPWSVRDAIPLTPPGAIRAMDSVQRDIADGRASPGLAATLAQQGIGYVVLRADLEPRTSRSARPLLAQQSLDGSPGLKRVATFGPRVGPATVPGVVRDNGLRPAMPAIQIYAVDSTVAFPGTGPVLVDADDMPRVDGGPEALAAIQTQRARIGKAPIGPALLSADARRAGLDPAGAGGVIVTDTPTDRETDFGRVDDHSSAIRAPGDPRRTQNAVADYPVDGQPLVQGQWLLANQPGQVHVTASESASDATQPGQTSPSNSPAAAFDQNPRTAWVSGGLDTAVGKWLRLDFSTARSDLALTLTTAKALGSDVNTVLVTTEAGSTVASGIEPGKPVTVTAPSGATTWVEIRAIGTADGLLGNQFALSEVGVTDLATNQALPIRYRVVLPPLASDTRPTEWLLTQELDGRSSCVNDADVVRCAAGLGLTPETPGVFTRALSVPSAVSVTPTMTLRPVPGDGIDALLATPGSIRVGGSTGVADPRGNPAAAVDGSMTTTWTAPESDPREKSGRGKDSDEKASKDAPELVIGLPQPQLVERLKLSMPHDYPARPTRVIVDLGTGEQRREVGRDGVIDLDPAVTQRISVRITKSTDLIDVNALGFARPTPPGITEVQITPAPPAQPDDDRVVDIGCDAGIGMTVSGQMVAMASRTTAGALRRGEPIVAVPCSPVPLNLGQGEQELTANPGSAFAVQDVHLSVVGAPDQAESSEPMATPRTGEWSPTHREVHLDPVARQRVLVVPESTNPGWEARVGGRVLAPVVVNGWQQGWVVPAGTSGMVTLNFGYDGLYRWSIGIGLGLVAILFGLAFWPRRRVSETVVDDAGRRDPIFAAALGAVGAVSASWLLCGWWGLAITAVLAVVCRLLPSRVTTGAAGGLMMLATLGLAAGPWHSPGGYQGSQWWVQLAAFGAVGLTMWSAVVNRRGENAGNL